MSGYDASEWKPGDVAIVTGRWIRTKDHTERYAVRRMGGWISRASINVSDREVSSVRPLVVIDPEDTEQVERLLGMYVAPFDDFVTDGRMAHMQAALREFARPTVRVEEPTGLGAVVEDAKGRRWLRWSYDYLTPWIQPDPSAHDTEWSEIHATRILSPGVEATP